VATSESRFMQSIFSEDPTPPTPGGKGAANRGKPTVCGRFQQSLANLVHILSSSSRHYVRCIKPNDKLQPNIYTPVKVLLQLRSNGIFETIKMRKAGYASHIPFDNFYKRFGFLGIKNESKDQISVFLRELFPDKSQWVIGKTKVFLKDKTTETLEVQRREIYIKAIVKIQSRVRVYHLALKLQVLKEQRARFNRGVLTFQRYIRCWNAKRRLALLAELYNRRMRCIITVQKHIRGFNARRRLLILYRDKLEREKKERERQAELQRKEKEKQLEREKQEKLDREKQEREKKR